MSESNKSYQYPPSCRVIDGVINVDMCTEEDIANITHLPLREDDIILSTYPKSGQTWVLEVIKQILNSGTIDETSVFIRTPFLEAFALQKQLHFIAHDSLGSMLEDMPSPRVMKTHLQYHLVPRVKGSAAKYITVMRNPKDAAVSYYHHHRRLAPWKFSRPWDEFFEMFIEGNVMWGSWFDHVLEWWKHRDEPNTLLLKYEDLIKDHSGNVRTIAAFLGKELPKDLLQRVIDHTSFKFMKDQPYFNDTDSPSFVKGETTFIRTGVVGDWRNYFTEEQNLRFDELYAEKMKGSGLELDFDM